MNTVSGYLFASSVAILVFAGAQAAAEPVVLFDFTQGVHGWQGVRVEGMEATPEGLAFRVAGEDPWIESPPVANMPAGHRVQISIRMRAQGEERSGQVFFGPQFSADNLRSFAIQPDGEWHTYSVVLPPQPEGTRLRIDPAHSQGEFTIQWIQAKSLAPLGTLTFDAPTAPPPAPESLATMATVRAGTVEVLFTGDAWNSFVVYASDGSVDEDASRLMAMANHGDRVAYLADGNVVELPLGEAQFAREMLVGGAARVTARLSDSQGANWTLERTFQPIHEQNAIDVQTTVTVDQDRQLVHLPWITLFPGLREFETSKTQAVLPGVEYLSDEPSSSEADLRGEQAIRRIVDDYRICFPMMALASRRMYVGIVWNRDDHPAAVFDSPDRIFNSGASVMGLWYPGVGEYRLENELVPMAPMSLAANQPLRLTFTIIGGPSPDGTIIPAVQQYVAMRGIPNVPEFEGGFDHAVNLLAHGWLDSAIREGGLWRHAVWGDSFPAGPAADAPAYMQWLANHTSDAQLAQRLREVALLGLESLPENDYTRSSAHVHRPSPPLLFSTPEEMRDYLARQVERGREALGAFDAQGIVRYTPQPGKPNYAETHWQDHENGLAAAQLEPALEAASLTGDPELIQSALQQLDRTTELYAGTVPRGAQTWEMPLHTPDILGSGRLVRCYLLGYLISGEQRFLDQARYWAWTGVPFVYLSQPVPGEVGTFATIGVIGATNWQAPNWIGQPVQWCGLVYRSAIRELAQVDEQNADLWKRLADGITVAGLQMTFPLEDQTRQGLLPDFFLLKPQVSDGPAISPGTVQANLAEVYGKTPFHRVERLDGLSLLVHVPGDITQVQAQDGGVQLTITPWTTEPYFALVTKVQGAEGSPPLGQRVNFTWTAGQSPSQGSGTAYAMYIPLQGPGTLTLSREGSAQ